jgi:hypothetical protein
MIYVFKDGNLISEIDGDSYYYSSVPYVNEVNPKTFPTDSYQYDATGKCWYVKRTRKNVRQLKDKHVPKELKALCLLMGISA